jgi:hypothetical protein
MLTEWKPTKGNPGPRRMFTNPLLYTSTALVFAIIYVGVTFLSRWEDSRKDAQKAAEAQAQKAADDAKAFELQGGNRFEILNFYVAPPVIERGGMAELCYSVSNTKAVKLDPPAGRVWPSLSRCLTIEPKKDTTYTLTAEDSEGQTKTAAVTLHVR